MKKIGLIVLFSGMAWLSHAQITKEQLAQKMRPEYKVDLTAKPIATKTTATSAMPSKSQLEQEIAGLEAQNVKNENSLLTYKQEHPNATAENDAMLKKYQQAIVYNQTWIDRKKQYLQKLAKN